MCGTAERLLPTRRRLATIEPLPGCYRLRGHLLPSGDLSELYVVEGRITFEPVAGADTLVDGAWLVPGLVDAHAHLALASPLVDGSRQERIEASARAQLAAGVLLLREPGGPDHGSARVGPGIGLPRTVTAGRFLAPPGGYFPGLAREVAPEQLVAAVAEEAAAGTGWVKIVGDYPDQDGNLTPNWGGGVLAAAARAAHAAGARITVHAVLPETIEAALAAGFDAIEHGTGMPGDLLPVLAARGAAWVPTLLIGDGIRRWARQAMSRTQRNLVERWLDDLPGRVAAAIRLRVRVLAGTDAGMVAHGLIADEVQLLVDAGVPAEAAVGAASWDARAYLGLPGLAEGAPADVVAFRVDPREDPATLADRQLIVLDGRVAVTR